MSASASASTSSSSWSAARRIPPASGKTSVKKAAATGRTIILNCTCPECAKKALAICKDGKPILNGATPENYEEMSAIATEAGVTPRRPCRQPARAGIVIMGDLNGKANTPAQKVLGTKSSDKKPRCKDLYNTGYYLLKKNYGSYRYKGNWQTIDHLILSGALLDGHSVWKADRRLTVFSASFLLEEDKTYFGYKPCPTYRGPRYVGGYSDHLPIYIDLKK